MKHFFPKTFLLVWLIPAAFALHPNCGGESNLQGGAEAGNPPVATRTVTGSVPKTQSQLAARADVVSPTFSCIADEVIVVDSTGEETAEDITTDCSFSITLIVGKAYSFGFSLKGSFVASMNFSNSDSTLTTSIMVVGNGEGAIALGTVQIAGGKAIPENQPATQTDQDSDGSTDFDDEDDNDNGVPDTLEEDCDLDGYWDVYDDDTSECVEDGEDEDGDEDEEGGEEEDTQEGTEDDTEDDGESGGDDSDGVDTVSLARIVEVNPKNGTRNVEIDEEVEVRAGCEVDASTVSSSTFFVRDQRGNDSTCDFKISESGTRIECDHDRSPFSRATTYTASVFGLSCKNGNPIESVRWQWTTR